MAAQPADHPDARARSYRERLAARSTAEILADHAEWVQSGGFDGEPCDEAAPFWTAAAALRPQSATSRLRHWLRGVFRMNAGASWPSP